MFGPGTPATASNITAVAVSWCPAKRGHRFWSPDPESARDLDSCCYFFRFVWFLELFFCLFRTIVYELETMAMRAQRRGATVDPKVVSYDDAFSTLYPAGFYCERKREEEEKSPGRYTLAGLVFPKGKLVPYLTEEDGQVEGKYKNSAISVSHYSTDGTDATLLNGISRGTSAGTRVGSRVGLRSFNIRMFISFVSNEDDSSTTPLAIRIMVVYDKQANGVVCPSPFSSFYATAESVYRDRFIVMYDEVVYMEKTSIGGYYVPETPEVISFKNVQQKFRHIHLAVDLPMTFNNSDTGVITDINTGSVYLVTMTTGITARGTGHEGIVVTGNCETRWVDA